MLKIGVDVGGTNTDAVLMRDGSVLASAKRTTTVDVCTGIVDVMTVVLEHSAATPAEIQSVMIGSTQFTNAFVQRTNLTRSAAVRLGFPAARGIPPFADWPEALTAVVAGPVFMIGGGYEFDGREIGPLDEAAVADAARAIRAAGVHDCAVSGVFSHLDARQEQRAAEILRDEAPGLTVSLSSEIGRTGLLERENAALMNASLRPLARQVIAAYRDAMARLAIHCPLYVSQNDGTLMSPERVQAYPVLTFAAGPTNSLRGAAYLSGLKAGLVVDIGGTTADIGVLVNGFPRQSALHVDVGGVRTNFRMPDMLSIGLGGGSRVRFEGEAASVGPDSVGFELQRQAQVFGGPTLTTTDIAVALGRLSLGDPGRLSGLTSAQAQAADHEIHRLLEDGVDRMKTSAQPTPLVLVGGGAVLVGRTLAGVSEAITPKHASVANAVGAALGQVGGEVDRVVRLANVDRDAALAAVREEASAKAVAAGADPATLEVIEQEELPLQYVQGGAARVVCRVVGDLAGAAM